jgi:IS5 family transposase
MPWPDPQLVTTAANEHDLNQLGNLLHGEEQFVSADAGYQGAPQREELAEVDVDTDRRASRQGKNLEAASAQEQNGHQHRIHESQHPCQVEHPFRIIKRQFGFVKARYKGC